MKMRAEEYRMRIESDEAIDEILENGEEVEMKLSPEREVRITVRLKPDEVKMADKLADQLGVGRSTALKIALRMAAQGLVLTSARGMGEEDLAMKLIFDRWIASRKTREPNSEAIDREIITRILELISSGHQYAATARVALD